MAPDATRLGDLIRAHWSVEPERSGDDRGQNQCHHVLEVTYHENHCQVRDRTTARNLTCVREIATKFLKVSPVKKSLRSKRKRSALEPGFREGIANLIFQTFNAQALLTSRAASLKAGHREGASSGLG